MALVDINSKAFTRSLQWHRHYRIWIMVAPAAGCPLNKWSATWKQMTLFMGRFNCCFHFSLWIHRDGNMNLSTISFHRYTKKFKSEVDNFVVHFQDRPGDVYKKWTEPLVNIINRLAKLCSRQRLCRELYCKETFLWHRTNQTLTLYNSSSQGFSKDN